MAERLQTVVVTGATSFVGMHLARQFCAEGFRVVATTSRPSGTYDGIQAQRLRRILDAVDLVQLDLRDARAITALVDRVCPTLWLHHAGYAANYASANYNLAQGFSVNVVPLPSLYTALSGGRCGIIITGSSAEYASSDSANREEEPCWPCTPYGILKLSETLYAAQLSRRHMVPTRIARLYIPFGPLDHPEKLLAQTVAALSAGRPVALSACSQVRDFIGVSDVCKAYVTLAQDLSRTQFDIFNICSGEPVKLRDLLLHIAEKMGASAELLHFGKRPLREGEPAISYGSNGKARILLNWEPASLHSAIDADLLKGEVSPFQGTGGLDQASSRRHL